MWPARAGNKSDDGHDNASQEKADRGDVERAETAIADFDDQPG
jgi:hypothetical protein